MTVDPKALVHHLAVSLVDLPDGVSVTEIREPDGSLVLELRVSPEDLGKVIGKRGITARAMRTVLSAAVMDDRRRVHLNIAEE